MKKPLKKIYLEITNACNLSCSFCIKNQRPIQYLKKEEFTKVLSKIEPYTDYLYFHLLGEPLMHPNINELINQASKNFKVQITTNGYLIEKIADNPNIRQLNISLHSFNDKYNLSIEKYMNNIFNSITKLLENNTYISLRIWTNTSYRQQIINMINNYYECNIDINQKNIKIAPNLYFNLDKEFIWPDLNNDYYEERGTCYALKDHIGILVDGTIVPCCLDTKGIINLGNIYTKSLNEVLTSNRVITMKKYFNNNYKHEELCKHCSFLK